MIESYSARVSGTIWNRTRAWTTYTFQSLPTREQIIEKAGDFQHVSSITLTRTTIRLPEGKL